VLGGFLDAITEPPRWAKADYVPGDAAGSAARFSAGQSSSDVPGQVEQFGISRSGCDVQEWRPKFCRRRACRDERREFPHLRIVGGFIVPLALYSSVMGQFFRT
jgi:hypothetical protein